MEIPETRYAKSGDVSVAYQVTGGGSIDLVWAPGTVSHLDLDWDDIDPWRPFIERLGTFTRLIRFDKRGTGLSDRPTTVATLEERTDDIRAVMDARQRAGVQTLPGSSARPSTSPARSVGLEVSPPHVGRPRRPSAGPLICATQRSSQHLRDEAGTAETSVLDLPVDPWAGRR